MRSVTRHDDHDHAGPAHAHAHPGHDPGLGHGHAHGPVRHDRAFAIGIVLNLAFVGIEAFYGWRIDSLALLADAGHNLSDVAGLVLAWAGAWAARLPADGRHTYGWQRAGLLAAFANAVLLLVAMGSLALEAVQRLQSPASTQGLTIMVVAGIGIVVNTATALLFLRGSHGDLNIRGAFLHMAADALVSAGVVLAGWLALRYGWPWIDPVVSLAIAVVIVVGTAGLLRQSVHLLFDGVPDGIDLAAVREVLQDQPGVQGVSDLHVWATGTTRVALTAHLVMSEPPAGDGFYAEAAQALRARFEITHITLQVLRSPADHGCAPP